MEKAKKIVVMGVGGAGSNVVDYMISQNIQGAEFWAVNTDKELLNLSKAPKKIQIGTKVTNGLGAGGNPTIGQKAAEESKEDITAALDGADVAFIVAGLGGGTGTGAISVIPRIAKELGVLTINVATIPFRFEGKRRASRALEGLEELQGKADSIIVIPNENIIDKIQRNSTMRDAFVVVNKVISSAITAILDIISDKPSLIGVDLYDIKQMLQNSNYAYLILSEASGEERAKQAAQDAVSDNVFKRFKNVKKMIVNITGDSSLTLFEVSEIIHVLQDNIAEDVEIVVGAVVDDGLKDIIKLTIITIAGEDNDDGSSSLVCSPLPNPFPNEARE